MPLGSFETVDARLRRLRNAMSSTEKSMGDTVSKAVDLEARRRAMEENLRKFRDVERRQQPSFRRFEPTPIPAPRPSQADRVRGILESGRSPRAEIMGDPAVIARIQAQQRPIGEQLETFDLPRQFVKRELIEPVVPGFAVDVPKEAVRGVAAALPGLREVQQVAGQFGVEAPDITITDELVEEAASWLADPLNVLPVVGFGPEIVRGGRAALRAGRPALRRFLETPQGRKVLQAVRGEAGGPRLGGEGLSERWRAANPVGRKEIERRFLEDQGIEAITVGEDAGKFWDSATQAWVPKQQVDDMLAGLRGTTPPERPPIVEGPPPTGKVERGTSGAENLLRTKEETLLQPGRVTQFPGVKQAASGLNPSVSTERNVLVSYNARQAAAASLETEFAAARQSPLDELKAVFRDEPPRYTGPDDNPFKNTLKDWGDNPEHYVLTPRHRAAAAAYDAVGNQTLARSTGEFGVKVDSFPVKEGGFFAPTVATKESLDDALKKVSEGYTSASVTGKGARTKTRVYEGAYQRWQRNPDFRAETNLDELTGLHDRALAKLAGDETFRLGAGGKTRIETVDLTHPGLRQAKEAASKKMTSLRGRIDTAHRQIRKAGVSEKRLETSVKQAEKRARPVLDRIDELGEEWGAELSHLSGQAREITARAEALRTLTARVGGRGTMAKLKLADLQAQVRKLEPELDQLRKGYATANLEPFVLNRKTFRFHQPEQSAAIDSILQTKLNIGQGFADAIDEVRLTAFAADVSPLTIQGMLGGLSHPITTATNARNIARALWNPDELLKIATREPELVERFTIATGRPLGEVGPEFVQQFKGIERVRIPFTQLRPGHALNRRLMGAVEEIRYAAWKTDQDLLRKMNPGMTQNVADAESANFLSKMIPALNPAETGRSALRARFERIPIISTSFLSSPPALTKDMASALAKLGLSKSLSPAVRWQALSGREQLAILRGLNLAGSLSALTVGSYVASGFSPEEAVKKALDPTGNNPRFLSIAIGKDRYIPIGGPARSFIRGMVPTKVGEVAGVPIYVPFVNTKKWLEGKVTPAIKAPIDLARNKDFFGGKIATGSFPENILRAVWYGANSILPLAAAEPSEAIRRGEVKPTDVAELGIRGGGQLAGSDVRELRLREAFERETGRSYAETPSALRRQLIADSPLLQRLAEQQEVFFPDESKRIRTERSTELLPHAQAFLRGGLEAARAYSDNRKFIMAKFGGVSEEVFGDLDIEPKGRDNELLAQYYEVDFRADHNGNGVPGDDEDVRLALEEQDGLKTQMSSAVQGALGNPENFFVDKEVIEAETLRGEAVDAIREIVELPKWVGLTVEEGNALDDLASRIRADVQRYKAQAVRVGLDESTVSFRSTAEWLANQGSITELDAQNAVAVSSGEALRDRGRMDLALEHKDVLLRTFPDFFGSVLPVEAQRTELAEEEIEQLQPAGVR